MRHSKFPFFIILILLCLSSCKKEYLQNQSISVVNSQTKNTPPEPFNWETGSYLPTNPKNIVYYPWLASTVGLNAAIAADYKTSDGWNLIYSTFGSNASPYLATEPPGGLYFALYNIYRGLIRFYFYLPTGYQSSSTNIEHGLKLSSPFSSILNFESLDYYGILNLTQKSVNFTKTNNQQLLVSGNWVVCEYELAYDPSITSYSYPSYQMTWNGTSIQVSNITLSGTQAGTISGSITTPAGGFSLTSTLSKIAGVVTGAGLQDLAGTALDNLWKTTVNSVLSELGQGFFSAIKGGSASTQQVHLQLNSDIQMSGNTTSTFGVFGSSLVLPGQAANQAGPTPGYNNILGVYNFSAAPVVYAHSVFGNYGWNGNRPSNAWQTNFSLGATNIVLNPSVTNVATVSVVATDIIILPNTSYIVVNSNNEIGGHFETVGNIKVAVNPTYMIGNPNLYTTGSTYVAVRFTIKVTPKNGAKYSLLTKTVYANVIAQ